MANFVKIKYFFRDTNPSLPPLFKDDIIFPKYEHYINLDTIELITSVKKETILIKLPYSSENTYEEIEIFIIKTISDNFYFCLKDEFSKFIKEDNNTTLTL